MTDDNNILDLTVDSPPPRMVRIPEVVKLTGIPYETIRRWCQQGKICNVRAGRSYYINWELFVAFLQGHYVDGELIDGGIPDEPRQDAG